MGVWKGGIAGDIFIFIDVGIEAVFAWPHAMRALLLHYGRIDSECATAA